MGPPCRTAAEAAGKLLGSMGSPEPGAAARVPLAQPREQGGDDMARVVVVGDLMTDTVAHAALALAKGSDTPATVSMHGGGSGANIAAWLVGPSSAPLEGAGAEAFLEMTNGVTLLLVNADQATVLTGREDPESAAHVLTAWYPEVVVKLGPDGALYANGRPDPVRSLALPVETFVDGTGAGDAFCA